MIQKVESLTAELKVQAFRERNPLVERQIHFAKAGTGQSIPPHVPIGSVKRHDEGVRIEVLIGAAFDNPSCKVRVP